MNTVVAISCPVMPLSNAPSQKETGSLRALFGAHRWRILATYALFNLENMVRLAQPLVLGWAVSDLLAGSSGGLVWFALQHFVYLALSIARRMYDIRAFSAIYTELATALVVEQRGQGIEVSQVAARSALSRELVDFFERDLPAVFFTLYSLAGALILLTWYDWILAPLCLALAIPLWGINRIYGRLTLQGAARLNDRLEKEVATIARGETRQVRRHYALLARFRINLSDYESVNFGLMEVFVLGLMAIALVRSCQVSAGDPGNILAIFRYVVLFVSGLDTIPHLVRQFTRILDIRARLKRRAPDQPA